MKQFFLTVLGVFTGLILFLVVVPVVLLTAALATSSKLPPSRATSAALSSTPVSNERIRSRNGWAIARRARSS